MKQQIYANIADDIIEKIQNNKYQPNEKLPSERILCEIYKASISSIKKALKKLIELNYLYSVERMGYYVMPPKFDEYIFQYNDQVVENTMITEEYLKPMGYIKGTLIKDINYDKELYGILLKKYKISSKTLINYEEKYIFVQKNTLKSWSKKNNFHPNLNTIEKYSANSDIIIDVDMLDHTLVEEFKIKPDLPFFRIIKKSYDKYGKIISYTKNYYRFDNFRIQCTSEFL
ncbi:MAG: GntR family transcriptional regulator [Eubacteriales bacterium]